MPTTSKTARGHVSLPNLHPSFTAPSPRMYSASLSHLKRNPEFTDYQFKPAPFYTRWVNGYNQKAGIINLNDAGSTTIFYGASNFGILYNWTTEQMKILQGHRHMITCIAADLLGKWLVTADSGPENIIIIWDNRDIFPNRTIFAPHGSTKLSKMALSGDAKYLLTLAYEKGKATLNWWIWSFGLNEPHAKLEVPVNRDSVIAMEFNPTNSSMYLLLTKQEICVGISEKIFVWERGLLKETDNYQLKINCPLKKPSSEIGKLTCFCFVTTTSQVLVGSNRGAVLVYGYTREYTRNADNSKLEDFKFIKTLKIDQNRINVIKFVDETVVTGNGAGQIHFYDDQMKLLYWVHGFTVKSVRGLSFNINPRSYMLMDNSRCKKCQCWESVKAETDSVTGELRNVLLKKKIPTDATKGGMPFLVRDFIVWCHTQGIGFVDFVTEKKQTILDYRVSYALGLTVHPEKKLICVGYIDGTIELINFKTHKLKMRQSLRKYYTVVIPPNEDSIIGSYQYIVPKLSVTCVKYSPSGFHLACGLNTGQLIFLDPTTIDIKTPKPFQDTKFAIKEFAFSDDSLTLAFADTGKTVGVYKYDCEKFNWNFIGKHRAHFKDITSILFLPDKNPNGDFKLLSFGMDRLMAEYDIGASGGDILELLSVDRIEQTAAPLVGIVWPKPENLDPVECHTHLPTILVANNEFKYKIMNYETTMTLRTYLGPRFLQPVRHMQLVYKPDDEGITSYLLFATKVIVGLQKLPLDGNPWKHVGMVGHPNQVLVMCFRDDTGTLFTIGAKDNCFTQWNASAKSVEKTTILGGLDLDPYYCLIENGRPGWLFQEIRDLFYYIQILCQGTFTPAMRRVKDHIPIESLPDLMRALGYFPTEYEVENLLVEAKYQVYRREPYAEIDFEEFVKLYLNHRPAFLDSAKKLKNAFKQFSEYSKKDGDYMWKEDFIETLCQYGEKFDGELAWYLLSILCGESFEDRAASTVENYNFLHSKVRLTELAAYILGIPDFDAMSEQPSTTAQSQLTVDSSDEDSQQDNDCLSKMFAT